MTTWIPDYLNDQNPLLKEEAHSQWQRDYNTMREFLQQAAKEIFMEQPEICRKYARSGKVNRPFPSSSLPPLQSESKCEVSEVFVMVISSTLHMNEN